MDGGGSGCGRKEQIAGGGREREGVNDVTSGSDFGQGRSLEMCGDDAVLEWFTWKDRLWRKGGGLLSCAAKEKDSAVLYICEFLRFQR